MIGTPELLIILLIVVLLFGSTKIPQLGDALGKGIKNFKSSVNKDKTEDDNTTDNKPTTNNTDV